MPTMFRPFQKWCVVIIVSISAPSFASNNDVKTEMALVASNAPVPEKKGELLPESSAPKKQPANQESSKKLSRCRQKTCKYATVINGGLMTATILLAAGVGAYYGKEIPSVVDVCLQAKNTCLNAQDAARRAQDTLYPLFDNIENQLGIIASEFERFNDIFVNCTSIVDRGALNDAIGNLNNVKNQLTGVRSALVSGSGRTTSSVKQLLKARTKRSHLTKPIKQGKMPRAQQNHKKSFR